MHDNTTPHSAENYDLEVLQTIPYHHEFHLQAIDLISRKGDVSDLLDIGCGTGTFEKLLLERMPDIRVTALDPSERMIREAEKKTSGRAVTYLCLSSEDIRFENEFDAVTAIQAHHYLRQEQRRRATGHVYRALRSGGMYISFENIVPDSERLKAFELERWKRFQISAGKTEEEADAHIRRCGAHYFPITVEQHIQLLKETGFTDVYVFWRSYMQMGIMAFKCDGD